MAMTDKEWEELCDGLSKDFEESILKEEEEPNVDDLLWDFHLYEGEEKEIVKGFEIAETLLDHIDSRWETDLKEFTDSKEIIAAIAACVSDPFNYFSYFRGMPHLVEYIQVLATSELW